MNAPLLHSGTFDAQNLQPAGGLRLRVHTALQPLEQDWRRFEKQAVCTVYQSYDWCHIWIANVGQAQNIKPLIVTGENYFGELQFILPLQVRQQFGVTIIEALTAPLGAYAFGLFQRDFYNTKAGFWFENHMADVIAHLPKHDVFRLADIVEVVEDVPNPLMAAGCLKSANQCHIIDLQADFQAFYELKRPGRRRRYLRNRDAKLEAMGEITFTSPSSEDDIRTTMTTMLSDQDKRMAEAGVHNIFSQDEKQFLMSLALCNSDEGRLLQPYALRLDGKVLAVISGAWFNKTFWALVSSLAAHDARKHSPGDYALRSAMKAMCERGARHYDFSVGDADYKSQWSDRQLQLHLVLRASTFRGMVVAGFMLLKEKTKRLVKTSPLGLRVITTLRRQLRGIPPERD